MPLLVLKRYILYDDLQYTPLYEKGIKDNQNKPMETNDLSNYLNAN